MLPASLPFAMLAQAWKVLDAKRLYLRVLDAMPCYAMPMDC